MLRINRCQGPAQREQREPDPWQTAPPSAFVPGVCGLPLDGRVPGRAPGSQVASRSLWQWPFTRGPHLGSGTLGAPLFCLWGLFPSQLLSAAVRILCDGPGPSLICGLPALCAILVPVSEAGLEEEVVGLASWSRAAPLRQGSCWNSGSCPAITASRDGTGFGDFLWGLGAPGRERASLAHSR